MLNEILSEAIPEEEETKKKKAVDYSGESRPYFGYVRQSKEGNSWNTHGAQTKAILSYMEARGLKPEDIAIKNEDGSAYGEANRPVFDGIMRALERDAAQNPDMVNHKHKGIIFFDLSRLSRNQRDFLRIEKSMEKWYEMLSVVENIIDSASGFFFFRSIQIESIYYSDRQSSKATRYMLDTLQKDQDKSIWGVPPYGYDTRLRWDKADTAYFVPHEVNSRIICRIFELANEGKRNTEILIILGQEFEDMVNNYNNTHTVYEAEQKESTGEGDIDIWILKLSETMVAREKRLQAKIPSLQNISDCLKWGETLKYNGKREQNVFIRFSDDIRILNSYIGDTLYTPDNKPLRKWKNLVYANVPKLQIVDESVYTKVLNDRGRLTTRAYGESVAVYQWKISCTCWGRLLWKKEWNKGKNEEQNFYYQCENSKGRRAEIGRKEKVPTCTLKSRHTEKSIDNFFQKEILSFLLKSPEVFTNALVTDLSAYTGKSLEDAIKIEKGYITRAENELREACDIDEKTREILAEKVAERRMKISVANQEIEEIKKMQRANLSIFLDALENFTSLEAITKRAIVDMIVEQITMNETRDEEHRYINPDVKNHTSTEQYQKTVIDMTLNRFFQILFLLNRYHGGT